MSAKRLRRPSSNTTSPANKKQPPTLKVDRILTKLLSARGQLRLKSYSPKRKEVNFQESELIQLCTTCRSIFLSQPSLLNLKAKNNGLQIVGDIHGQFYDLLKIFEIGDLLPPNSHYLFLGDYVDRGKYNIETISLLFALKVLYPKHLFLLRGKALSCTLSHFFEYPPLSSECRPLSPTPPVHLPV